MSTELSRGLLSRLALMPVAALDATTVTVLGLVSLVMFIVTLAALPPVVALLPEDYFLRNRRQALDISLASWIWLVGKNVVGALFVAAGLAMLLLPGQGVLTILVGLMLMNFPGKRRMERWLVSRPRVLTSLNWLRQKFDRPPLLMDEKVAGHPPSDD